MTYRRGGASAFNQCPRTLEEFRNNRLNLRRYSVVADLVVERATHTKVAFNDVLQADSILFFREYFPEKGASGTWYPRCMVYAQRAGTLPLFAKATASRGFTALRELLKVKTPADLIVGFDTAFRDPQMTRLLQSERFWQVDWDAMLNLQNIRRVAQPQK